MLDSKDLSDQEIIDGLPKIADFLDEASKEHFAQVLAALDACGVAYTVNPRLVRGLDYYTRTTFEFTVPDGSGLGTQNALLGGGRYDGLSEMLGGPKAPGIGFAIGEDRLILTLAGAGGSWLRSRSSMRSLLRWAWRRMLRRWRWRRSCALRACDRGGRWKFPAEEVVRSSGQAGAANGDCG